VAIRVRPLSKKERESKADMVVEMPNPFQVDINHGMDHRSEEQSFTYDHAFWSANPDDFHFASQEKVYDTVGRDITNNGLDGFNSTLFAYGQTGSGKTYTVLGSDGPGDEGVLPRVMKGIFEHIEGCEDEETRYTCHVSYLQIYNEVIQDLLIPRGQQHPLEVRHHPTHGSFVPGLTDNIVRNYSEVQKLLKFGSMTRSVASTNMNNESSRSHCIFTMQIEKEEHRGDVKDELRSKVNLVDLAGAERQDRAMTTGQRLKEGAAINQSLSQLANVIHGLAEQCEGKSRNHEHIPFRNSKLTYFLKESLSGNSKTCMLATIAPGRPDLQETLSTLRFAKTCKNVRTQAVRNLETKGDIISKLNLEIQRLKEELGAAHDDHLAENLQDLEHIRDRHHKQGRHTEMESEADKLDALRQQALDGMGLTFDNDGHLQHDRSIPQLVNISDDPYIQGSLVFYLHPLEVSIVGSDRQCNLVLNGLGIKPFMCSIFNKDNVTITLTRLGGTVPVCQENVDDDEDGVEASVSHDAESRVLINGKSAGHQYILEHTDRIIFGHSSCFRFLLPSTKRKMSMDDETDSDSQSGGFVDALREVCHDDAPDFGDYLAMLDSIQDRVGTAWADQFASDFREAWPLVEEGNMITSELRAQDDVKFTLEVTFDTKTFTQDYPELIVRLSHLNRKSKEMEVVDVFEFPHYLERLEHLRQLHFSGQVTGAASKSNKTAEVLEFDPWTIYTAEKVIEFRLAANRRIDAIEAELKELKQMYPVIDLTLQASQYAPGRLMSASPHSKSPGSSPLSPGSPNTLYPQSKHRYDKGVQRKGWTAAGGSTFGRGHT
jgi:hypothetical protein